MGVVRWCKLIRHSSNKKSKNNNNSSNYYVFGLWPQTTTAQVALHCCKQMPSQSLDGSTYPNFEFGWKFKNWNKKLILQHYQIWFKGSLLWKIDCFRLKCALLNLFDWFSILNMFLLSKYFGWHQYQVFRAIFQWLIVLKMNLKD